MLPVLVPSIQSLVSIQGDYCKRPSFQHVTNGFSDKKRKRSKTDLPSATGNNINETATGFQDVC